jgi:hypothetical protein
MPNPQSPLRKIISGGQTGADRAALDAALHAGCPCGGWCPKGRIAEDGKIPARYQLREHSSKSYADRTLLNIQDADGTLVVTFGELKGGSAYTLDQAASYCRPCLHVDAHERTAVDAADKVMQWIIEHQIYTLNIAGSQASNEPAIYIYVYYLAKDLLRGVFLAHLLIRRRIRNP